MRARTSCATVTRSNGQTQDIAEKQFPEDSLRTSVFFSIFVLGTMVMLLVGSTCGILRLRDIH